MGSQQLHGGDVVVPAGAPYGYTAGPDGVEVIEIRQDIEHFGISYLPMPAEHVEKMLAGVDANKAAWARITEGPLMATNRQGAATDPES